MVEQFGEGRGNTIKSYDLLIEIVGLKGWIFINLAQNIPQTCFHCEHIFKNLSQLQNTFFCIYSDWYPLRFDESFCKNIRHFDSKQFQIKTR